MPTSPVPGSRPRGQQPRCAPARRPPPRRSLSRKRRQSYRLRDARSRSRAAAWPQAGQPAPEEEIIVTAGTPHGGPAARQAREANNHRRGPGNGRARVRRTLGRAQLPRTLPADRRDSRAQPRRYREHDVTALGQVLIATSVLACGIIYGTDVFSAIVLRPALALAS